MNSINSHLANKGTNIKEAFFKIDHKQKEGLSKLDFSGFLMSLQLPDKCTL